MVCANICYYLQGQLLNLLNIFSEKNINLTSINSKLNTFTHDSPFFHIDVEGPPDSESIKEVIDLLRATGAQADILPPRQVPWFPINIRDLDLTRDTLDAEVRWCVRVLQLSGMVPNHSSSCVARFCMLRSCNFERHCIIGRWCVLNRPI